MKSILLEIYFFYTPEIIENIFNLIKYLLKSFFKLSGGNTCIFFCVKYVFFYFCNIFLFFVIF